MADCDVTIPASVAPVVVTHSRKYPHASEAEPSQANKASSFIFLLHSEDPDGFDINNSSLRRDSNGDTNPYLFSNASVDDFYAGSAFDDSLPTNLTLCHDLDRSSELYSSDFIPSSDAELNSNPSPLDALDDIYESSQVTGGLLDIDELDVDEQITSSSLWHLRRESTERLIQQSHKDDETRQTSYCTAGITRRYSKSVWEKIKPHFLHYYLQREMDLETVMHQLAYHHHFYANEQMYKKRIRSWGAFKNVDKAQKHYINTFNAVRIKYGLDDQRTIRAQNELHEFCQRHHLESQVILDLQRQQAATPDPNITETYPCAKQENQNRDHDSSLQDLNFAALPAPWMSQNLNASSSSQDLENLTFKESEDDLQEISAVTFYAALASTNRPDRQPRISNKEEVQPSHYDNYENNYFDFDSDSGNDSDVQEISEAVFLQYSTDDRLGRPNKRLKRN